MAIIEKGDNFTKIIFYDKSTVLIKEDITDLFNYLSDKSKTRIITKIVFDINTSGITVFNLSDYIFNKGDVKTARDVPPSEITRENYE